MTKINIPPAPGSLEPKSAIRPTSDRGDETPMAAANSSTHTTRPADVGQPALPQPSSPLSLAARAASLLKRIGMKEIWSDEELSNIVYQLDLADSSFRSHLGYFSRDGWAARCLRWHLSTLAGRHFAAGERFTEEEVRSCLETWLTHGEESYSENRFEDLAAQAERAARGLLAAAIHLRASQKPDAGLATDKESRLDRDLQADGETEGEE